MRPLALLLLVLAAALAAPAAVAQGDPAAEPKQADDTPILDVDRVDVEAPPFRLERPSDSWAFLDVQVLHRQAIEAKQDVSGYVTLKARLFHGSTRSNIFVSAEPDVVHRRETPGAAELARPLVDGLVAALVDGKLKQQGAVRVGAREGWLFEVHGKARGAAADAPPLAVVRAVVYRPEDHHIFTLTLEAPADKVADLRKDLLKLLKKARI